MSKNKERWGIFLLGPLGEERRYCMVRAASYISARTLAMEQLGGSWDQAPAEIVGDALIDEFPRILLETTTPLNLVPASERGTQSTDGWLYTFLGYGVRQSNDTWKRFNVETLDRRHWVSRDGTLRPYGRSQSEESKDSCGIFEVYEDARDMLMDLTKGSN